MKMDMSTLEKRVSKSFPDATKVDDNVLRFTRSRQGQPFAVYYLDISTQLPNSLDGLIHYQDRVIGQQYFEGRQSLQWNNYLYFLRDEDELAAEDLLKVKSLIEGDRTYARKFVVAENDLERILEPTVVAPNPGGQEESIISTWMKILEKANLVGAIASDDDLPTRLSQIENPQKTIHASNGSSVQSLIKPAQPIIDLNLTQYRPYPLKRSFQFGTVNLIFGQNASGKTSLLEAVELFYCGKNKRNPGIQADYSLEARLKDGTSETATSNRQLQIFRDRNLAWYGQSEVKTTALYKSFARFNFLDTDAAVNLSESTADLEADLSKLLVGPDASKIWEDMQRVLAGIKQRLNDLKPQEEQIKNELTELDQLLSDISNEQQQSAAIISQLKKILKHQNWQLDDESESTINMLNGSLTDLISIAQQAIALEWIDAPVTKKSLAQYSLESSRTIREAEPLIHSLERLAVLRRKLQKEKGNFARVMELIPALLTHYESGLIEKTADVNRLKQSIANDSKKLSSFNAEYLKIVSEVDLGESVFRAYKAASMRRSNAETAVSKARKEYDVFAKLRQDSINLAQQLRQIAGKIIQTSRTPDTCPLCHTEFECGQLSERMNIGVDGEFESLGQTLLSRIQDRDTELQSAKRLEDALLWMCGFCEASNLNQDVAIGKIIGRIEMLQNAIKTAEAQLKSLQKDLAVLAMQGVSLKRLEELSNKLAETSFSLSQNSAKAVRELLPTIEALRAATEKEAVEVDNKFQGVVSKLASLLGRQKDEDEFKRAISGLKEQIATTDAVLRRLTKWTDEFVWPDNAPVSELVVVAENARLVAREVNVALAQERKMQKQQMHGEKHRKTLGQQLSKLSKRIEQYENARVALDKIYNEHSLTNAMEETLAANRTAIEEIFVAIHSPAEFSGLGDDLNALKRKDGNRISKLSEISTGQRAAFGLSIFLAQNSQVVDGPPVILIDDPIAHVDDLNSLSFLDYLREIAVKGSRQIFFTTSNDRLASLFERKFDFLGDAEFKRFNLSRTYI